jgi:hypothetical protein
MRGNEFRSIVLILIVVILTLVPSLSLSDDLDSECKPDGITAKAREAWDPKSFWREQIKEIADYVDGQKMAYRLAQIERKREQVNARLDDEEMKAMGIESFSDPELDLLLDEVDRDLIQMEREMLSDAVNWGRKCTYHAERKLSSLK